MLKIDDIHVNYGEFEALRGISLVAEEGEIVALLGGNGAGKTTTINTISGTTSLKKGSIQYDNQDLTQMSVYDRVKAGVVQVPEGRKLFSAMSVYENLLIGSYLPKTKAKRKENLEMCFELFPKLYERRNQMAGSLSGGEQQMCAISRALMECPKLLMMDEPSLGLAPLVVEQIFEKIVQINKMGVTILLVEQNVVNALEIASRAYVIEVGKNVIDGESSVLVNNDELKRAYLGL